MCWSSDIKNIPLEIIYILNMLYFFHFLFK